MRGFRGKAARKATGQISRASVQSMSEPPAATCAPNCDLTTHFKMPWLLRGLAVAGLPILLQVLFLMPRASAAGLQSNSAMPSTQGETVSPAISDSLRPALQLVGHSIGQIQIDRWKVSKDWKQRLQNDADSISGDLSHQLPGLLQQAQATPTALDAQLRLMQNVDALYDVLVRLTMAADLTDKKSDAALLDSALQQLEAARKTATAQLVAAAAQQYRQLTDMRARVAAIKSSEQISTPGKTIVVDNEARHGKAHHATHHHKKATPSTSDKPAPQ